ALPVLQLLAGRFLPRGHTLLGAAAAAGQHALRQPAVQAQGGIAQSGTGGRLPWPLDRQPIDLLPDPIETGTGAGLEVEAGGFGDADPLRAGELDDVERGIVRVEARDA